MLENENNVQQTTEPLKPLATCHLPLSPFY